MNETLQDSVKKIVNNIGGQENINSVYHCATRLRFQVKDKTKFNKEEIEKIDEIIGTKISGNEIQLIIGGKVNSYYSEVLKNYEIDSKDDNLSSNNEDDRNIFIKILDNIVGIMSPIIIAFIGFGMLRAVLALLVLFGLSQDSLNYQIINMIGDAGFYFIPFMIAASAARQFKTNSYLAIGITGILLHPTFMELVESNQPLSLFNIPIRSTSYGGQVIPIIIIIWFMSYVDRFAEKVSPNIIKTMLKPLLIVVITAPVALIVLGPIGAIAGDGLFYLMEYLRVNIPWLIPTLMGIFTPILVMVGMHTPLGPIAQISLTNVGYEIILGPGMLASNISQAGASFGVFVKSKSSKMKQIALSSSITALSGITEPALYGVNLKLKKPLIYVMISGGIAGFYAGISGLVRYSFGAPGLLTLPVFFGDDIMNIIHAVITILISFTVSFLLTIIFGWDTSEEEEEATKSVDINKTDETIYADEETQISTFVNGEVIPLNKVDDEVFASETMGKGIAIKPNDGTFISPVKGRISSVFPTGHAIGITTDTGLEMLLHIGIDTVNSAGNVFDIKVNQGDEVEVGTTLVEVNLQSLEEQGFDTTTMLVILNSKQEPVIINETTIVNSGDLLFTI